MSYSYAQFELDQFDRHPGNQESDEIEHPVFRDSRDMPHERATGRIITEERAEELDSEYLDSIAMAGRYDDGREDF